MSNVKLTYYVVKRGQAFWQPTKKMKAFGFQSVPLGADGPDAWKLAQEWSDKWQRVRRGEVQAPTPPGTKPLSPETSELWECYPVKSFGMGFHRFRNTEEWKKKPAKTREEWWRAWRRIKPIFGDVNPRSVTLEQVSAFRSNIEKKVSLGEAHRTIKIWRALWKKCAAMKLCERDADPSLGLTNNAPKGRHQQWTEGEVVRTVKRAWRMGYHGLAVICAVAWDSQLDPGDIRDIRANQIAHNDFGVFFTERNKTGKPVGALLSKRTVALLVAYLDKMKIELLEDAFVFRHRGGRAYSKDTLGDDFRDVRAAEFGLAERRTLGHDYRRSGAGEAIAGKALPAELAHAMGNTLSASNALFRTYVPVNSATLLAVVNARRTGRMMLRETNAKRTKVGMPG